MKKIWIIIVILGALSVAVAGNATSPGITKDQDAKRFQEGRDVSAFLAWADDAKMQESYLSSEVAREAQENAKSEEDVLKTGKIQFKGYGCSKTKIYEVAQFCHDAEANQLAREANQIALYQVWNKWPLWIAIASTFLSFASTVGVFFALRDGRKTAKATIKALDIGRARIVVDSNVLRIKAIRDASGVVKDPIVTVLINWRNVGERIALNVRVSHGFFSTPLSDLKGGSYSGVGSLISSFGHVDGKGVAFTEEVPIEAGAAKDYVLGKTNINVFLQVTYSDALDPEKKYIRIVDGKFPPIVREPNDVVGPYIDEVQLYELMGSEVTVNPKIHIDDGVILRRYIVPKKTRKPRAVKTTV